MQEQQQSASFSVRDAQQPSDSVAGTRGILLANLGTPDHPDRKSVARFLREFLSDPRVVDLPRILWLPLLYCVIVPLRAGRSAAAYREIWGEEGSPLMVYTQRLAQRLSKRLAKNQVLEVGMRYGQPSIRSALERLRQQGVDRVTVLPLYPQFSYTTTESIYDAVTQSLSDMNWDVPVQRIDDYHENPVWITAMGRLISEFRDEHGSADRLMISMHGIPQRYVRQGDPYQEQCERSAELIAAEAGLSEEQCLLTYQSRVGREPWLQPYTDKTLEELGQNGITSVQVICPGFAVDCLETLEEIAMENAELFEESGGQRLDYIPALNDRYDHVDVLLSVLGEADQG